MMNINLINELVKGISEQIPLVNSFYTLSPYEVWNTKEVQYGSVSFVITKVNTNNSVTAYECVIYYADRLMEGGLNRDAIHSDSATVIQTIVGAMNQSDEYIKIDYPVGITLFEQDFTDLLAGGYATINIEVDGMGECFDGEFEIPEIVGTSAYYNKEEINELFPLKNELSKVSFTGDFSDLTGIPDLVTRLDYNGLVNRLDVVNTVLSSKADQRSLEQFVEGQNTINVNFAVEMRNKVSSQFLDETVKGINIELDNKVSKQVYDTHITNQSKINGELTDEVDRRVLKNDYNTFVESINSQLENKMDKTSFETINETIKSVENTLITKADQRSLEQFVEGQNTINVNLAVQLEKKVDDDYFDVVKSNLEFKIDEKLNKTSFENKMTNIYTKKEVDSLIETELNRVFDNYVDSDDFINDLESSITENVDKVIDNYVDSEEFRVSLENIVEEEVKQQIGDYVTSDDLEEMVDTQLNLFIESGDLEDEVESIVNTKMGDYYEKTETYNKSEIDRKLNDKVNTSTLADYPTKSELYTDYYNREEVRKLIDEADITVEVDLTNYYPKSETYNKTEIDQKLKRVVVDVDMSDYYDKTEIDSKITTINGRLSGLQTQIDNIEVGGGSVDLTRYLLKSDAESIYCKKTETYNKTEIDSIIGDINTILNNVLYEN